MQIKPVSPRFVVLIFGNMCLMGFLNSMRGVTYPLIRNEFNASYNHMGIMNALISFSAVSLCVGAGLYMSHFGLKRTMITAFLIVISAVLALYFVVGFWMTVAFYLILQAGFSFSEISINGTGVRIFTRKSGLMLNLLHFCFGAGAIIGPRFVGYMTAQAGFTWQEVYPIALIPVLVMLTFSLAGRFPAGEDSAAASGKLSFWAALRDPLVWFFGVILGTAGAMESCSVSWSGLFLEDVYGLDPGTDGALFVSCFFALYTLSRFLSGFVIEKTGYLRSILVSSAAVIVLFTIAFSLGRQGIYLLPVTGFFIGLIWPTVLAISVEVFREKAQTVSSAMISIAFTLSGIIQYGFGLTNHFAGAAWSYRSCVFYSVVLFVLLFGLRKQNRARAWNIR